LRNAPAGFRQVVDIDWSDSNHAYVDKVILRWGKLGYDLHDRSEYKSVSGVRIPSVHVVLTFVKR
jgi:hypothetical protein